MKDKLLSAFGAAMFVAGLFIMAGFAESITMEHMPLMLGITGMLFGLCILCCGGQLLESFATFEEDEFDDYEDDEIDDTECGGFEKIF